MTAGAELLDQERYPSVNVENMKRVNMSRWGKYKIKYPLANEDEFLTREGQLAWPTQLAKEYDIPCYNYAQGATGFAQQLTQFLKAYRQGLITPTTLVLWGLTAKERGIWIQDYTLQSYMINGMMDPPELKEAYKEFWYIHANNDYMTLWYYYQNLHTMLTWAETLCNDQLMFIHSLAVPLDISNMPTWESERYKNAKFVEVMRPFWKILEPKYKKYRIVADDNHTFFDWAKIVPNGLHGGRHPVLQVHKDYAKFLYQNIEKTRQERLTVSE
jgi:hypothetical protein